MDRLSTDTLVEILQRLPHSCRRHARHVSRRWRDVVNNRITETQSTPKLLIWSYRSSVAYVADDLSPSSTGSCTELWRTPLIHYQLIGTCNGLLCLYHGGKIMGGRITMLNPATGETLPLPPLPCAGLFIGRHEWNWEGWGGAYSCAYHPTTGQFKVVHVPCSYERIHDFHEIHVLTLGKKATWREVSAGPGGAICKLAAGVIGIHGMTYWVRITGGAAAKIVKFDHTDDRVISTTMPVPARHDHCRLVEVDGRLGYVVLPNVWVLEEGQRWSHRYNFEEQGIPRGHFVYGEYVLTHDSWLSFYGHRPNATCDDDVVQIGLHNEGMLVAKMTDVPRSRYDNNYETFAYVETMEPLSIYATHQ